MNEFTYLVENATRIIYDKICVSSQESYCAMANCAINIYDIYCNAKNEFKTQAEHSAAIETIPKIVHMTIIDCIDKGFAGYGGCHDVIIYLLTVRTNDLTLSKKILPSSEEMLKKFAGTLTSKTNLAHKAFSIIDDESIMPEYIYKELLRFAKDTYNEWKDIPKVQGRYPPDFIRKVEDCLKAYWYTPKAENLSKDKILENAYWVAMYIITIFTNNIDMSMRILSPARLLRACMQQL